MKDDDELTAGERKRRSSATSAFETEIETYPRSCYIASGVIDFWEFWILSRLL